MPKRKAETSSFSLSSNDSKKVKQEATQKAHLQKSTSLLADSDSSNSGDDEAEDGGVPLEETNFHINEEFARRFEHNKKREELQRLEEKYQKAPKATKGEYGDKYDEDSESSSDETEDDNGILATEDLDAEISATLQAIRNKDPIVYDEKVTFYTPIDEDVEAVSDKKEKPVYLRDYHRENLLAGYLGAEGTESAAAPRTFAQEQDDLKKSVVREMHEAADRDSNSDEDDGGFLVRKSTPQASKQGVHPSRASNVKVDVTIADKDPETFLSNFMAARAWVPGEGARFQPLESDDDDEVERAEKFETAYNLRFEDPKGSNEMLKSYARDVAAAKSVRRAEPKSRKKQRDVEREKRDAEKREREDEKARLRKLKIEEIEEKLRKIKKAAGIRGKTLKDGEWSKFLDEGWDDDTWELEMNRRFGEGYYAEQEDESGDESDVHAEGSQQKKKRKVRKPKWDDDIDIKDIIPEFEKEGDANEKPAFTLSDSDADLSSEDEIEGGESSKKAKSGKDRRQEKVAKKKAARLERKKIENLVDNSLDVEHAILPGSTKQLSRFRYRETSPTTFGLTARDILMADDTRLNEFVGLKKMATFRDPEKKRKDKKRLGKKARLREWRRETFGNEDGPEIAIGTVVADTGAVRNDGVNIVEGKKRRKRSKKHKVSDIA